MSEANHRMDLERGRWVIQVEEAALKRLRERLNERFSQAVDLLVECRGKIVVAGMGKSGIIGRKIAATLSSTGSPAVFLHPAEAIHGDLGVIGDSDVIVAISYGGETSELEPLIRHVARKNLPFLALTSSADSLLARSARVWLDVSVDEEACPLGLAPTASSTVTLALGDALAVAVFQRRGFRAEDFAELHPGGSLGRRLLTRVLDVMHSGDALPLVLPETSMRDVIALMTQKEVRGVAGIVDENGLLVGVVTDGDIRRRLERSGSPLDDRARDLMSRAPKTIDVNELAEKALFIMEQFSVQTLFVVDKLAPQPGRPIGLLHFQDLLRARLR